MAVMNHVDRFKLKEKIWAGAAMADAVMAATGNEGCKLPMPQQYAVKDINNLPLLYAMEYSSPCTRCWCPSNVRAARYDVVPAAAVHDPSGDANFNFKSLIAESGDCWSVGGASQGQPVAFTIEREACCNFMCCRCRPEGACCACCRENMVVRKGPADPSLPIGEPDPRPILGGVRQEGCAGCFTPTLELFNGDSANTFSVSGEGGICQALCGICYGTCMCACCDNKFKVSKHSPEGTKFSDELGYLTRKAPENCMDVVTQACTPADNYDIQAPQGLSKEDKAAMVAAAMLADMMWFDENILTIDCAKRELRFSLFTLHHCGMSDRAHCTISFSD